MNFFAWALAYAFAWFWAWHHLSLEWIANEQYQYGWGVPALFALCAIRRWHGVFSPSNRWLVWIFLVLGGAAFWLGELLRWHDPIWRLTGGLLVLGATFLSAAACIQMGGWSLLKRQLFPLAFAWTALPWPTNAELFVTQNSLRFLTEVTVGILNILGFAALQRGNLIELANCTVGIETACSGVQSLQSSLMAALFLGEFFRFAIKHRIGLVAAGWGVALLTNLLRVLCLSLLAASSGTAAVDRWHPLVGGIATVVIFASLIGIARWLEKSQQPQPSPQSGGIPRANSPLTACTALCLFLAVPLLTAFKFCEAAIPQASLRKPLWSVHVENLPEGWQKTPWPAASREWTMLRYSQRDGWIFRDPKGQAAHLVHLFWLPGENMPSEAFYHTPAMCLPWTGWNMLASPRRMVIPLEGKDWAFVVYEFGQVEHRVTVLQALFAAGLSEPNVVDPSNIPDRKRRLLTLWQTPLRQVNEEILLYLPHQTHDSEISEIATTILNQVLKSNRP